MYGDVAHFSSLWPSVLRVWACRKRLPSDEHPTASASVSARPVEARTGRRPRADGGTDLHLLETGFRGPDAFRENGRGWDVDVLPSLIDLVDGAG